MALGLVYWIVDVRGWKKWGFFFKIIGVNPLTVYLLSWTVLKWEYEKEFFFGELLRCYPGPVMNCIAEWGTIECRDLCFPFDESTPEGKKDRARNCKKLIGWCAKEATKAALKE